MTAEWNGVANRCDPVLRFIMLDIDGVLCIRSNRAILDPECVQALNLITATTGANIIISSGWRHYHPMDKLVRLLADRGITGRILGKTDSYSLNRGYEIQKWLDFNAAEPWQIVILDDYNDMDDLCCRLVQTDPERGLTRQDALQAIRMLRGEQTHGIDVP